MLVLSLILAGCGDDANGGTGMDAGTESSGPDSGNTVPTCGPGFDPEHLSDASFSSAIIFGLNSPVFDYSSIPGIQAMSPEEREALDNDRLSYTYNGLDLTYDVERINPFLLCSGPASVEITHGVTGELIGRFEWEAELNTISDPGDRVGPHGENPRFTSKAIVVFGSRGNFSTRTFVPDFSAPEDGRWRFHILNGMLEARVSARLVSAEWVEGALVAVQENPAIDQPVVTELAPKEIAIVEVAHPHWNGPEEPVPWSVLEYWFDDSPNRHTYQLTIPYQKTGTVWPDGTIAYWIISPDTRYGFLEDNVFFCRDSFWREYLNGENWDCGND
jgi:hypothetical protein